MSKYLIVNSDDFGISWDVSRGILEAHHRGIVTSTTTMINMPDAEKSIKEAQQSAPELGLGLHFVLSYGNPVSAQESVPTLIAAGGGFVTSYQALMERLPEFAADDVKRELHAQFNRFCDIAGQLPDHLDSHHGATYMHPVAFEVMIAIAQEHDLPIRWGKEIVSRYDTDDPIAAQIKDIIARRGQPRGCDHIADFTFDFQRAARLERLKAGLRQLEQGYTELIVHVGYGDALEEDYNWQRNLELEAITNPELHDILRAEAIQLCNFGDLP